MYSLCLVTLRDDQEQEKIKEAVSKITQEEYVYFEISSNAWLLKRRGLTSDVGKLVGFEEGGVEGTVFALSGAHNGYERRDLWEWLEKHGRS